MEYYLDKQLWIDWYNKHMPSKHFADILDTMKTIHEKKSHDYSATTDPFSNFRQAAELVKLFNNPIDQVFAGIIGIKLSRIAQLLNGKEALNESTDDSFIDCANYMALWGAYYRAEKELAEAPIMHGIVDHENF